jgi:hypothetical protein
METEPVSVVEKFFESAVALAVPFQYINSHLLGIVKKQPVQF